MEEEARGQAGADRTGRVGGASLLREVSVAAAAVLCCLLPAACCPPYLQLPTVHNRLTIIDPSSPLRDRDSNQHGRSRLEEQLATIVYFETPTDARTHLASHPGFS
eukprot:GHVU01156741.1.p2 GENE.GHVU01156741.1~~GHVU01156741.1.p2  ORF type:complete len:106 (-),score=12.85 GHVU01156741.1:44-361(-)